jgi:ribulose-5-phosphate 4-epimerase/fuculose-1-phosphate aldolase
MNDLSHLKELLADLVAANLILAKLGVLDAFGHVSARNPVEPTQFLLARSMAPALVTAQDIMQFDAEGKALGGDTRLAYLERFIHAEIYRARPDVQAVVHSHAPNVIGYAASSVKLQAIYHMSAFLGQGVPVWDIADQFGATDLLVRNLQQGASLAVSLASESVVLMRGHGYVTVAEDIPNAVSRAVYTDMNASLQTQAIAIGGRVKYLSA